MKTMYIVDYLKIMSERLENIEKELNKMNRKVKKNADDKKTPKDKKDILPDGQEGA